MDKLVDNLMKIGRKNVAVIREKAVEIRDKVNESVDQLNQQVGDALLGLKKQTSYRKVGDAPIYAVRHEDSLKLLLREDVRHVHIAPENYPETYPVFLVLTNDIDEPYVFVSAADMQDALTFARI